MANPNQLAERPSVVRTTQRRRQRAGSARSHPERASRQGPASDHRGHGAVCPAPVQLSCVQSADRELADAFAGFATELRRIDFPASAQAEAVELADLADRIASALRERATATSPEEYQQLATADQQLANSFDQQELVVVRSLSA